MIRLFTKDSTGVAPNGRVYAGDINAIQDAVAAILDFAQTLGLGTLQIGDAGIGLLKYGTAEARLTAALRTDGILRALGGLYAGAFTTTARDAIASGSRPYGLVILNTTTNRLEWNAGSDATPSWLAVGVDGAGSSPTAVPSGAVMQYGGSAAPTGWLLCDGASYLRSSYGALFSAIGSAYGSADGTHFNVPDFRGRVGVGKNSGTFSALGATGGEETHTLVTGEMPSHSHGGATGATSAGTPSGTISSVSAGTPVGALSSDSAGTPAGNLSGDSAGTPAGSISSVSAGTPSGALTIALSGALVTGTESSDHSHDGSTLTAVSNGAHAHNIASLESGGGAISDKGRSSVTGAIVDPALTTDSAGAHTHTITGNTGGRSAAHTHTLASHGHAGSTFAGNALAGHTHAFAGTALGTHSHTFTGTAMAGHSHSFTGTPMAGHIHAFAGDAMATHTHVISAEGGGNSHNNLQPYLVVNYIIKT